MWLSRAKSNALSTGGVASLLLANVYLAVQLVVLPAALIWLYRRSPDVYRRLRNTAAATLLISTPVFRLQPGGRGWSCVYSGGDVVAASRKAVRAPSSAASSGSIDSIICVRSRPPCRAAKVDSASVRGFA
jgi:hypothetical protein